MKTIVFLALFLCGCAETRIYDRGKLAAVIQGDAVNVTLRSDHTYFHADALNHSAPTAAAYKGASQTVSAIASGVVNGLLLVKP